MAHLAVAPFKTDDVTHIVLDATWRPLCGTRADLVAIDGEPDDATCQRCRASLTQLVAL